MKKNNRSRKKKNEMKRNEQKRRMKKKKKQNKKKKHLYVHLTIVVNGAYISQSGTETRAWNIVVNGLRFH